MSAASEWDGPTGPLGDHLAHRARVAFLLADLARLAAREHAVCSELSQLLEASGPKAAAADLSRLLEQFAKGAR